MNKIRKNYYDLIMMSPVLYLRTVNLIIEMSLGNIKY